MAQNGVTRRGLMLVLSSPRARARPRSRASCWEGDGNFAMSISATTRPKRPGEVSGRDYHFVDPSEFNLMINRDELLEYAKVFDHYYGTPRVPVEEALAAGRDVLFDIDWQGAQQVAEKAREGFGRRVHLAALDRGVGAPAAQPRPGSRRGGARGRMAKAADEMSHWAEYDYIVVNEDVEKSVAAVQSILQAERLRRPDRQVGLRDFVERLRGGS